MLEGKYHKIKNRLPNLKLERKFWRKGYWVIGVDEVGRGALAGPVFVGTVCFYGLTRKKCDEILSLGINDSKKLSSKKREELAKIIKKIAVTATASSSVTEINRFGIVKATQKAIRRAVKKIIKKLKIQSKQRQLSTFKIYLLLDAFYVKYLKGVRLTNQLAIVKGDQKSISIAAASIIAKTTRDSLMKRLAKKYPRYHWEKNKGYGTAEHIEVIKKYGKTKLHRGMFLRRL